MLRGVIEVPRDLLWDVIVPVALWGAAVMVCVFLGLWLSGILRQLDEEEEPGRRACPKCSYDVRATPDICPECGHEVTPIQEPDDMPIYTIPPDSGPFVVVQAPDKSFAVIDQRAVGDPATAAKLGFLFIPCRDEPQATEIADRLNRGDHDGTIQVDLLSARDDGGGGAS